ncbi:PAS domain S-box protein [bacterium]|nr:PAS domain S-box protein [bacterium]
MTAKGKGKIFRKILWPFVIIFSVLIISLVGSLSHFVDEKARLIIQKEAQVKINVAEYHFEITKDFMTSQMRHLSSVLGQLLIKQDQLPIMEMLLKAVEGYTENYVIQVLDQEGKVIAENAHGGLTMPKEFSQRPGPEKGPEYLPEPKGLGNNLHRIPANIEKGLEYSSEPPSERVSIRTFENELTINILTPISQNDRIIGSVCLHRHIGSMLCRHIEKELGTPVYLFLNNRIAASSCSSGSVPEINLSPRIVQMLNGKKEGTLNRVYLGGREQVVGFLSFVDPENKGIAGHMMIPIDVELVRELSMGVIKTGSLYGLIGILILVFMGLLIARGITRPLIELVGISQKIGKGNLGIDAKVDSDDEIQELASSFNQMTENLKKTTVSMDYVNNIIKSMIDPLIVIDLDSKIQMTNKALFDLLGYERDEVIGKPCSILFNEEDGAAIAGEGFKRPGELYELRNYETYFKTKTGGLIPVLFSRSAVKGKGGEADCIVCTAKDITDRKVYEGKLRENQEYLKTIFDSIHTGIMIIDKETSRIFDVNPITLEMIGDKKERIISSEYTEHIRPVDKCRSGTSENGTEMDCSRWVLVKADGSIVPILKSMYPVILNNREYLLASFIDISERERAEEAIRQTEAAIAERKRLFSVLDVIPAFVCLIAPDHSIPFANLKFRNLYGDPGRRRCYEILHGRDVPCDKCRIFNVIYKKDIQKWEWASPKGRTYEIFNAPFFDIDNSMLVLELGIDITDRKQMEMARMEAERQLKEQRAKAILSDRLRSLGEMATGVAHELNQPLLGVRGLAEHISIALDRGWELPKKNIREKIQLIIEQADRMSYVIDHMRMFARGADTYELMPVQINDVIRSSLGLIGSQLRYRGLILECDLADDLPPVSANPFSLEEVVLNLINNARDVLMEQLEKGAQKTSPKIRLRTLKYVQNSKCFVNVEVIDCGPGIPPEIQSRVFEPFFTTKDPDKGTGLGLSISRSIIEDFHGTIGIDSTPDSGTTVIISLPAIEQV